MPGTSTKSKNLSFRCPNDLLAQIEKQTLETGKNKSQVILEMLHDSVPFVLLTETSKLPEKPAIYLVLTSDNRVLYIGKTNNLKRYWMNHHFYKTAIDIDKDSRIIYFDFDSVLTSEIDHVEKELMDGIRQESLLPRVKEASGDLEVGINESIRQRFEALCKDEKKTMKQALEDYMLDCISADKIA